MCWVTVLLRQCAIWRQSVLPVHLLGLAPLLGCIGPVAGDVKLQDDGVVDDPVNRRGGSDEVAKQVNEAMDIGPSSSPPLMPDA